jgi:hypothetical protein
MLSGQGFPAGTMEEVFAKIDEAEKAIGSREAAVQLLEDSTSAVIAALDALAPEAIGSTVQLPFGAFPMKFIMVLPGSHMEAHAAQIDYLQTVWGDLDSHFDPSAV